MAGLRAIIVAHDGRVSTLAEPPRISVSRDTAASALVDALADGGWALVLEEGRVLGLVDAADLRRAGECAVAALVCGPTWLAPESNLTRAWAVAEASGARVLALGDGESLAGIVDVRVLARALANAHLEANQALAERLGFVRSEGRATNDALRGLDHLEAVRELLRGLTHHLNNMVTSVDFLATALTAGRDVVDPGLLSELRADASSCRRFARDLLTFSRRGGVIRREDKLGDAVVATQELLTRDQPVQLEFEIEESLAASTFRRDEITAILAHLVDDALRATHLSMPPLHVRMQARWLPDGEAVPAGSRRARVELVVEDDAPSRGDETRSVADDERRSSRARWSPIGLAYEIVRACGGEWSVAAGPTTGRRVRVVLGGEAEPRT